MRPRQNPLFHRFRLERLLDRNRLQSELQTLIPFQQEAGQSPSVQDDLLQPQVGLVLEQQVDDLLR